MADDLKRGIRVYLESSDYGKGIEDMIAKTKKYETSLADLTDESKKMTAEGTNSGKAWDDLQTKIKRTEDQLKRSQKTEEDYQAKLEQTKKVLNNLSGTSYDELVAVQKVLQKEVKKSNSDLADHEIKLEQLQRVNAQVASSSREMNSQFGAGAKGLSGFIGNMSMMPGIVGYAGRSIQGLGDIIKLFLTSPTMIAITAVLGLVAGMYSLTKNSMEFSKAVSNLSALTGAVGKDLDYLKEQAKTLGKQYGKSAVEIVDAMKLVGSAKPELLSNVQALSDVTSSVILLSKATGMDLSESTKDVTTIMNQFGLSALDSDRTINVLAAGSKFGAVEVDYLGESISKVGTISKSAGLSLETTTAAMELFGEKGIKAEIAGNGFKKVLVELQSDTKNYTNGVFDLNKAIDNNQSIAGNNIALQKKFGQEFFGIAQILFQNKERFYELTKQVTGTNVALEQATIASDNLSGDVDKMNSSWKTFMLSLEDGKGPISNTFRSLVQWAKEAVDGMTFLTKSSYQRENELIKSDTEYRLKSFKQWLSQEKDKDSFINQSITSERNLYKQKQERMKQIESEISKNNELGGAWKKNNKSLNEEYEGLGKAVVRSIAYTNALGGLKSALKKENTPATAITTAKPVDKDAAFSAELEVLKEKYSKEQNLLKNAKLKEEPSIQIEGIKYALDTEQDYANSLIAIHIKYLTAKRDKYKKGGQEWQAAQTEILDIQLKQQEDGEKWLLKSVESSHKAQVKATNTFEKTEKTNLINTLEAKNAINRAEFEKGNLTYEEFLDKNKLAQQKYDSDLLALQVVVAEKRLKDAKDHADQIEIYFIGSEQDKAAAVESANAEIEKANEALSAATKAVTADKLKDEKDFYDKKKAFRDKFGLDSVTSIRSQYDKELAELKLGHGKLWATEKEYQNKVLELKAKTAAKYAQEAVDVTNAVSSFVTASNEAETQSLEAEKQKQLTIAGDDATKRDAINKEFAQKELDLKKKQADTNMVIQIAQATAAGALGVANIWAVHAANPVLAGILTALEVATVGMQIGAIVSQRNAIKNTSIDNSSSSASSTSATSSGALVVTQAAEGRWDVIGEDDGRTYRNVPYRGVARTGIVSAPTLMGERGDELIIDNPTLRNIRMNAPYVLSAIKQHRVSQRADGNYSSIDNGVSASGNSTAGNADNTAMLIALDRMIAFLQYLIDNGVKAPIVLSELEAKMELRDKSLKKGSLT
jgi:hypothetical protein